MAILSGILRWLGTTLILGAALFFLGLALGGHLQLLEARKLMATGTQAEATVSQKWSGGKRSTRYDFSYTFRVGDRSIERTVTGIGYGDYVKLQVGQRIPVWHEPSNAAKNITRTEMADLESWPNRLFGFVLGFALLGWGIARIVRRSRTTPPPSPS